ncbi:FHA domain-containing protein [Prosthecobacter sp.]|uniref:FHA domain-containing protein n=1 Tax=Prosthecobacter sp. TaxID=1965333 RepID=UPI002ABC8108|nr:FHA domain-containing protein [Prosthecobacter sp.]MDZ4403014.1 FHA domain-containing protein [Prosthecobacter sp.]
MAKLTFVLEDGQEVVVPLTERITIGRAEDNDVVVDDERISMQHAELLQNADGSIQVFDLKSGAGTFVNGERKLSCTLLHGDNLAFGPLTARLDLEDLDTSTTQVSAPPESTPATPSPDAADAETIAQLEAEKERLKAEVDAIENELRDWEKRAEKERALHLARIESLRAEEEQLSPLRTAVQQAESAHHEWIEAIQTLSSQHEKQSAATQLLADQHQEKTTLLRQLAAEAAAAQQEIEDLTVQRDQARDHLKQVRDECEQDEAVLNSLRQQIIEHETRIQEEEAKHATLATASTALGAKQQRAEAAVKDLESLLMTLEQGNAAAEGSLLRAQADLAAREKDLAARSTELAAENRRLEETKTRRAEIEQQCQELADTKQQLADARQRLAAVEQRYRDVQTNADQGGGPQIAARKTAKGDAPKSAPEPEQAAQHADLTRQIETARRELAELQAKIAPLRDLQTGTLEARALGGGLETEQIAAFISAPRIVQVESVRLAPIPMKSERVRSPGTGSTPPASKPVATKSAPPKSKSKKS